MLEPPLYLRLSVGEGCNYRCWYCRPKPTTCARPLSATNLAALIRVIRTERAVAKIRVTGGEPLIRPDILKIIDMLRDTIPEAGLYLTTNGAALAEQAEALRSAGILRINVSLDAAFSGRFRRATGGGDMVRVIQGVQAARAAGLPVKLNTVLQRSINGDHLEMLAQLAAWLGCELRFIELMPIGAAASRHAREYISAAEARRRLEATLPYLGSLGRAGTASRHRFVVDGRPLTLGFITPLSHPFCASCNRLRLDARGRLLTCLRSERGVDLAAAARRSPAAARRAVQRAVAGPRGVQTWSTTEMAAVGG